MSPWLDMGKERPRMGAAADRGMLWLAGMGRDCMLSWGVGIGRLGMGAAADRGTPDTGRAPGMGMLGAGRGTAAPGLGRPRL